MNINELKRKDMDEMIVETIMRTRFKPIQKKMSFFAELLINGELVETHEYQVPDCLDNKNGFFIAISNELQEKTGEKLRAIYNRD